MKSPHTIFLNKPQDIVILFGKKFTAGELQDALIDQALMKNHLELMGVKQ